jgi:hypothetical protein
MKRSQKTDAAAQFLKEARKEWTLATPEQKKLMIQLIRHKGRQTLSGIRMKKARKNPTSRAGAMIVVNIDLKRNRVFYFDGSDWSAQRARAHLWKGREIIAHIRKDMKRWKPLPNYSHAQLVPATWNASRIVKTYAGDKDAKKIFAAHQADIAQFRPNLGGIKKYDFASFKGRKETARRLNISQRRARLYAVTAETAGQLALIAPAGKLEQWIAGHFKPRKNPAGRPTPTLCVIAAIDTRSGDLGYFDGRAIQGSAAKAVTYTASRMAEDVVKTLKHPKGLTYVIAPAHWSKEHLFERLTGAKRNPASRAEISRAAKGLRRFSGHAVKKARTYKRPSGGVGYELGPISDITYIAKRDGETAKYHHPFAPKSRPSLVATSDGTALEIVGGRFRVTARGIVDL